MIFFNTDPSLHEARLAAMAKGRPFDLEPPQNHDAQSIAPVTWVFAGLLLICGFWGWRPILDAEGEVLAWNWETWAVGTGGSALNFVRHLLVHPSSNAAMFSLLFLLCFGSGAERALGSRRYAMLLGMGSVAALLAMLMVDGREIPRAGAYGPVAAIMGWKVMARPRDGIRVPAWTWVPAWLRIHGQHGWSAVGTWALEPWFAVLMFTVVYSWQPLVFDDVSPWVYSHAPLQQWLSGLLAGVVISFLARSPESATSGPLRPDGARRGSRRTSRVSDASSDRSE